MSVISPRKICVALSTLLLLLPIQAFAEELNGANTSWILTSTALVLFMTIPGLSLFYGGLVRSKNALSVLMQCFSITCLASIIWFAFGYSLAFGNGGSLNSYIGDLSNFFMGNITEGCMAGMSLPLKHLYALGREGSSPEEHKMDAKVESLRNFGPAICFSISRWPCSLSSRS